MEYAVIDVETTGLYHGGHDRIVEVAILRLAPDGSVVDQFETLLNPERDMGPTWLHGIETRDVDRPPIVVPPTVLVQPPLLLPPSWVH